MSRLTDKAESNQWESKRNKWKAEEKAERTGKWQDKGKGEVGLGINEERQVVANEKSKESERKEQSGGKWEKTDECALEEGANKFAEWDKNRTRERSGGVDRQGERYYWEWWEQAETNNEIEAVRSESEDEPLEDLSIDEEQAEEGKMMKKVKLKLG